MPIEQIDRIVVLPAERGMVPFPLVERYLVRRVKHEDLPRD